MTDLATLVVKITTDAAGFIKGVEEVKRQAGLLERGLTGMAAVGGTIVTAGLAAATAGAVALGGGIYQSVQAAMEAEKVHAQLNAVLESTGGVAGVTAEMATSLAESLSKVTMFEDEAILSAENLMLTFTSVSKDVFPAAIETALDMSQALGQDLQTSVIQLGKALQDPINGVTALKRVGVNFSEEQMKVIKSLVESGNILEAQKMILQELQTEFGGSAKAAGQTFAGQLTILKNALGDASEEIGMALLPSLKDLAGALLELVRSAKFQEFIKAIAGKLSEFAGNVVRSIPIVLQKFRELSDWLNQNKAIVVGVLAALSAAVVAFVFTTVIPALVSMITAAAPVIAVMAAIGAIAYVVYRAWTENWGGIRDTLTAFWQNTLKPFVDQAITWFQTNIPRAIEWLKTKWDEVWNAILAIVQRVQPMIDALLKAFIAAQEGDWYAFGQHLRQFVDLLWADVKTAFSNAWEWIKTTVTNFVNDVVNRIKTTDWQSVGKSVIDGIVNGVKSLLSNLKSIATDIGKAIVDAVKGFLGIKSPAKVFIEIGKQIVEGLIEGIGNGISTIVEAVGKLLGIFIQKDWLGTGRKIITDVTSGMVAMTSQMNNAANQLANTAASKLSSYNWTQIGRSIASQISSGVSGNSSALASAIASMFGSVSGGIGYSAWLSVGKQIVQKIAEGVKNNQGILTSAISSLMSAAYTAAYNLVQNWNLSTSSGGGTTPTPTMTSASTTQINVNVYANVSNDMDIEELAYRIANRLRVYV